ncbi:hypothetical protein A374_12920 [Fictibacillus macauensis ZFHKF-1]|uniref:DUF1885 family protein n=1 Tax=Fictibacillus macauensis ZFHKF-1 TaxID=1196324 RepID=I8AHQ7_9BACL|nr:DUF1885 family protein [Fictibacillus macauensis]EIT84949.1 hypothetical protein A374_12920 [Fictibacillus macauensis ZFHKF-1]
MEATSYIKLRPGSTQQTISLADVVRLFRYYQEITEKTGEQLDWAYENAAFPYEVHEKEDHTQKWLYLKGRDPDQYRYLLVAVDCEREEDHVVSYVQLTIPSLATHGDKAKANEFAKFLAKQLQGELHLFNGRIMHFEKRK